LVFVLAIVQYHSSSRFLQQQIPFNISIQFKRK
ncbi:unnamed protein product, partial [Rotaria socialis]